MTNEKVMTNEKETCRVYSVTVILMFWVMVMGGGAHGGACDTDGVGAGAGAEVTQFGQLPQPVTVRKTVEIAGRVRRLRRARRRLGSPREEEEDACRRRYAAG